MLYHIASYYSILYHSYTIAAMAATEAGRLYGVINTHIIIGSLLLSLLIVKTMMMMMMMIIIIIIMISYQVVKQLLITLLLHAVIIELYTGVCKRVPEYGGRAPVFYGKLREQKGEDGFPRIPTGSLFCSYRNLRTCINMLMETGWLP